ncbi:zona pellucida sperm-binding protein 3d.2 [Lampris incognitus]|uniref:zona pellucida sperm-binding protein 3d.2 n=1 Tax=Lampris incognitus TaxID=2546036 RepID=UPI0024B4A57A|nr:zona pellucida sperm-binding protein 3d.2 [Lampris incognitus]
MGYLFIALVLSSLGTTERVSALARFQPSKDTTAVTRNVPGRAGGETRKDQSASRPPHLQLPVFLHSRLPLVKKENFSPAGGSGKEQIPVKVRKILLPNPTENPTNGSGGSSGVRTWCDGNQMRVQVPKSLLGSGRFSSRLRLGTCKPTSATEDYLYFEHDIGSCGNNLTIINNRVAYLNTLSYDPPRLSGPIRRAAPFTLPISCQFNRYQYSYKIGYTPKMQLRKIFKPMKNRAKFVLTPRNAQWKRLSPSSQYLIGKPMYFQAEGPSMTADERLYINSCYATLKKSYTSMPQFPVIENFGCMVESKGGRSMFIPYKKNLVRFTVDAFLFRGMTGKQLYMHCTMSVGSSVPSPVAKSCNYDTKEGRWKELYGPASVCSCCDSKCDSMASAGSPATKLVSSRPWTVEFDVKSTSPKRKTIPPTATTRANVAKKVAETVVTAQPEERGVTAVTKEAKGVRESEEWPFGGGGVKWVEEEGDRKRVRGFAVVVEEEEVEEKVKVKEEVTEPRRIFEEIFDFDK